MVLVVFAEVYDFLWKLGHRSSPRKEKKNASLCTDYRQDFSEWPWTQSATLKDWIGIRIQWFLCHPTKIFQEWAFVTLEWLVQKTVVLQWWKFNRDHFPASCAPSERVFNIYGRSRKKPALQSPNNILLLHSKLKYKSSMLRKFSIICPSVYSFGTNIGKLNTPPNPCINPVQ